LKLNLAILREELAPLVFEARYHDKPYVLNDEYALPYHGGPVRTGIVYLVCGENLPSASACPASSSFIFVGAPPAGFSQGPYNMLITQEDISVYDLLDRVSAVFARYVHWEESMQAAVDQGLPAMEVALTACPFLENPIYADTPGMRCLFHIVNRPKKLTPEQHRKLQDYYCDYPIPVHEGAYPRIETMSELLNAPGFVDFLKQDEPFIIPPGLGDMRTLLYIVRDGEQAVAQLSIDEVRRPLTDRDFGLVKILGTYLSKSLRSSRVDFGEHTQLLEGVLQNLLTHKLIPQENIEAVLEDYRWHMNDTYLCMVLKSKRQNAHFEQLRTIGLELAPLLPSDCFTSLDGKLVFVFNLTQTGLSRDKIFEQVFPQLRDSLFGAGVSALFDDFKNLYYYYFQALTALTIGERDNAAQWYYKYEDYNLANLIQRCWGNVLPESLYPQGLIDLMKHDEEKSTDMVGLLRTYLENERNVAETSRLCYMHRSTLLYRLQRIEEISKLDLDDYETRLQLQIAFMIMDAYHDKGLPSYSAYVQDV